VIRANISADGSRAFLVDEDVGPFVDLGPFVLKAYASPDGARLRIVLPTLINFAQVRIDPEHHLLDFTRDGIAARRELKKAGR